jgi:hypothetical protein
MWLGKCGPLYGHKISRIESFCPKQLYNPKGLYHGDGQCQRVENVTVFTGDVSVFDRDDWKGKFDRVISIGK